MDENYKYYKDHGICPQCGVRVHAPGRVRCEICLAQNAESKRKRFESETPQQHDLRLERMNQYRAKMRAERKNDGKCIWCGKPLSKYSSCFCMDCKAKNQKNNAKRHIQIPRNERADYGICYRCGKRTTVEGKKLCNVCYEQSLTALKIAQGSKKTTEQRNYIRQQNNLIFGGVKNDAI